MSRFKHINTICKRIYRPSSLLSSLPLSLTHLSSPSRLFASPSTTTKTAPKWTKPDNNSASLNALEQHFASREMMPLNERLLALKQVYVKPQHINALEKSDVGKYVYIHQKTLSLIPRQIAIPMKHEFMAGGPYFMLRQPAFDVIQALNYISKHPTALPPRRVFGIRGSAGCGKSALLHVCAQYAVQSNDWLIMPIRAHEVSYETKGFIKPSNIRADLYDQALYTMDVFADLLAQPGNKKKLDRITLKGKILNANLPLGGNTLADLVELGAKSEQHAPDLISYFVEEIQEHPTEVPVMVLIDNINMWDQPSLFIEPLTYNALQCDRLALVHLFLRLTRRPPSNGVTAFAVTTGHATLKRAIRHFSAPSVCPIDVGAYDKNEFRNAIIHYHVSKVFEDEIDIPMVMKISAFTGNIPRDVLNHCLIR